MFFIHLDEFDSEKTPSQIFKTLDGLEEFIIVISALSSVRNETKLIDREPVYININIFSSGMLSVGPFYEPRSAVYQLRAAFGACTTSATSPALDGGPGTAMG